MSNSTKITIVNRRWLLSDLGLSRRQHGDANWNVIVGVDLD